MSGGQVHKVCRGKTRKRNWGHVVYEVKEFTYYPPGNGEMKIF